MRGAKIVHFEDDPGWREIVSDAVEGTSHQVVAEGVNLPSALGVLERIASGEITADVVILGGNLSGYEPLEGRSQDPQIVMRRIEGLELRVRTLGLAGRTMEEYGVKVDFDLTKERAEMGLIAETLDLLVAVVPIDGE